MTKDKIKQKTGLIADAYFSASKIKWLIENIAQVKELLENNNLCIGTIDSFLSYKLTGKFVTDTTNASRTMLYNIHTLEWDKELLELLDIPENILPQVKNSSEVYAVTDKNVCGIEVPIASVIGDQQAALFGQGCFLPGETKTTYGTGCFLLMNTGTKPVNSKHKLLTTIAIGINGKVEYALEGSVFIGGALIKWLRDELEIISSAQECDILADSVKDSNGVVLVPAFTGLGAPYWNSYTRGTIVGLTRGVNKAHICRAALDAIAFQVKDEIECMKDDSQIDIPVLKVDGGVSVSDLMLQFQSDILGIPVCRPKNVETTITGAAFLAGLAVGFWNSKDEILEQWEKDKIFNPLMDEAEKSKLYGRWQKAIECAMSWKE